jgi:trehalose 6-phosphate phosphatase
MDVADLLCPSCALFLDFDGTLVDLAEQPEDVVVPPPLIDTLRKLHGYLGGAVAIISGRPMEQLDEYLSPLRLPMAGVHGTERRAADGTLSLQTTYALDEVQHAAQVLADQHPALRVEHKRGSLALHYRQAPHLADECLRAMRAAVEASPGLTLMRGKMVVEAKPGGASKGLAIDAFMHEEPFAGRQPVFIGDDFTDEVGFTVVQRLGGMGVKVGGGPSAAWHRVESPAVLRDEMAQAVAMRLGRKGT